MLFFMVLSQAMIWIKFMTYTKIELIETNEKKLVKPIKRKAMSAETAYMITKVLEDTSSYAVGVNVNNVNYCAKTGTTLFKYFSNISEHLLNFLV